MYKPDQLLCTSKCEDFLHHVPLFIADLSIESTDEQNIGLARKVHLDFIITSYRKSQMNSLANPRFVSQCLGGHCLPQAHHIPWYQASFCLYIRVHTHTHKTSYTQWGKLIDLVIKHRGMLTGKYFMTCAFYQLYKIVP